MRRTCKTTMKNLNNLNNVIFRHSILTGNTLKIIAILSMVIDHTCKIVLQWLLGNYWGTMVDSGQMSWENFQQIDYLIRFKLQSFGVIAFPLFCFLLSEGFIHTKDIKKYALRILVFAFISEIPFDIGFFGEYSKFEGTFPFYIKYQNVLFTLFIGIMALIFFEKLKNKEADIGGRVPRIILQIFCIAVLCILVEVLHCDYGMQGVLYIVVFYIFRSNRVMQIIFFLITYMLTTGNQPTMCIILSCLIMLLYNGERGKLKLKYFFYFFYPLHILSLYSLQIMLSYVI